ncbi:MAG: hypothetical protein JWP38_2716 [Herbaspirillum sp.]|jgi:predicted Zn finger-like uncharacterized protein|nr:hypothetical protein [Herbaspirillum sp.]
MALATKCPFCQTTFRVANDQLKLRGGLVRCGQCQEVFDGNAHLLAEQQNTGNWPMLPAAPPPPAITPAIARANAAAPDYGVPAAPALPDAETIAEIEAAWELPPADPAFSLDAGDVDTEAAPGKTPAGEPYIDYEQGDIVPPESAWGMEDRIDDGESGIDHSEEVGHDIEDGDDNDDGDIAAAPGFVLSAQQRERRARVRRILAIIACVLLIFAALAQGIYLERDRIAAALPQLRPALAAACLPLGCTVGLQHQIGQLSIESNQLQAAAPGESALTLSLLLGSRSADAQAWPHIELTLNDDDGNALLRRVFAPADYLPSSRLIDAGIPANSEQPVKLTFILTQASASGYRVYLFYP